MLPLFQYFAIDTAGQGDQPARQGHGSRPFASPARFSGRRHAGTANPPVLLLAFVFGSVLLVGLIWRFPQEANRWRANQTEIRKLQEVNADLRKRVEDRERRLKDFNENYLDQEFRIRRDFHLYKETEKVFILPPSKPTHLDGSADAPAAPSAPNP